MGQSEVGAAVSRERLEAVANLGPPWGSGAAKPPPKAPRGPSNQGGDEGEPKRGDEVRAALRDRGISFREKAKPYGTVLELDRCLTSSEHTDGASIIVLTSGALAYKCQHASCQGKSWKDVAPLLGLRINDRDGNKQGCRAGERTNGRKRAFTFYSVEDYRKRPRPEPMVNGVLRQQGLAAIVGDPGTYKTFVAKALGLSVATGRPWFGRDVVQGAVAYILGEGSGLVLDRIDAWLKQQGIADAGPFSLLPDTPQLNDDGDAEALIDAMNALPTPPALVILDTLARTFSGNENATEDMNAYVAAADRIRAELGAAVLIVHHNNRQGEYRGSSALLGALDTMMETEKTRDGVTVRCLKQKDSEPFADIALKKCKLFLDDEPKIGPDTPINFDRPSSLVFDLLEGAPSDGPTDTMTAAQRRALTALAALNEVKSWASWSDWLAAAGVSKAHFSTNVIPALGRLGYIDTEEIGDKRKTHRCRVTDAGRAALNPTEYGGYAGQSQADWSAPFREQDTSDTNRDEDSGTEPTSDEESTDASDA